MTRVVFVNRYCHPDESATSQLLTDLCIGLAQRGLDVHVICSRQRYGDPSAVLAREELLEGVRVHRIWTTRFGRAGLPGRAIDYASFYVSCLFSLFWHLRCGDTVVAKTDPPLVSIVAMLAAAFKGARLVNWLQDVFPEVATELKLNPLPVWCDGIARKLRDRSLIVARMNVVLGDRMRERVQARGVSRAKIRVIENWASVAEKCPKPIRESRLRARLELGAALVVAYSGNLGRAHEFHTLLGAARILRSERGIKFLMIGGGAGMQPLQQAVLQEGLDSFRFLDYQPRSELADSLAAADAHLVSLLPALEGLIVPSKFYGILAAARPVVFIGATDGEVACIVREFNIGMAVEVGAAEELAQALRALAADRVEREAMGSRAVALFRDRYTATRALESWLEVLETGADFSSVTAPNPAADVSSPSLSGR